MSETIQVDFNTSGTERPLSSFYEMSHNLSGDSGYYQVMK